ncbi:MAG: CvpA family protein [Thermaerobacter sp.]|nr:CvpA family protein [Thermaerobacter sp.]
MPQAAGGMNWLDWVIVAYVVWGVWTGLRRGFLSLLMTLAGYVLGLVVAAHYYLPVAAYLDARYSLNQRLSVLFLHGAPSAPALAAAVQEAALHDATVVVQALVFLGILALVEVAAGVVAGAVARLPLPIVGGLNRLLGAALGGVEHLLIAVILLGIIYPLAPTLDLTGLFHASSLAGPLAKAFALAGPWLAHAERSLAPISLPGNTP